MNAPSTTPNLMRYAARFANGFAILTWLSLAAFFGFREHSWSSALNILAAGAILTFGLWAFVRLLHFGITAAFTSAGTRRLLGAGTLTLLMLAVFTFVGGIVERIHFVSTGEVLPFTVKTDYGTNFPSGELERLRKTDCADYGPLFVVQSERGYAMRCGDYLWKSHTYLSKIDPAR